MSENKNPRGYWTKDRCIASASSYDSITRWQSSCVASYLFAYRRGWLSECTAHMAVRHGESRRPKGYWGMETCSAEAKKFKYRKDWAKGHPSSYTAAYRLGIINECCPHMPVKKKRTNLPRKVVLKKDPLVRTFINFSDIINSMSA